MGAGCLDELASTVEEATGPEPELLGELLGTDGELPICDDAISELCDAAAASLELADPWTSEPSPPDLPIVGDTGEVAHRPHSSYLDKHAPEVEEDIVEVGHVHFESNSSGASVTRLPWSWTAAMASDATPRSRPAQ